MSTKQTYTLEMAQADQEQYLVPWAQDHGTDEGSPIQFMPPDPDKPWQAADVFAVPARQLPNVPERLLKLGLHYKLAKALGSGSVKLVNLIDARKLSNDLQITPAFSDWPDGPTVTEQIKADVATGKNIMVTGAHQILEDTGISAGAVTLATGRFDYISDANYLTVNPTMKYEGVGGRDVAHIMDAVGTLVWTIPYTPSSVSRKIPRALRAWYGRGASQAIGPHMEDPNRGTITYTALSGSRMIPVHDEHTGQIRSLEFPDIYEQTAVALKSVDRALPFALFRHPETKKMSWEIGSFISREDIHGQSSTEINRRFLDEIMLDLSTRMQRLAQVPIKYSLISTGETET